MGFLWFGNNKKTEHIKNSKLATSMSGEQFIMGLVNQEQEDTALKLSAVYSAISCISNTMSKIPFSIKDGNTKENVKIDNLNRLLNLQPNNKMNIVVMNKMIWTSMAIYGNAYILPVRKARSNEVVSLIPINYNAVTINQDEEGTIYYNVSVKGKDTLILRYDEIIHLKWNTEDGVSGISPLDYAKTTIQTGLNQEKYAEDFYKNSGRPDGVLKTTTDLSSKKAKKIIQNGDGTTTEVEVSMKDVLRDEWKKAHSGNNRFSTAILDLGLDYQPITQITPEQMQFVSSKTINVEDIARFFDMGSCSFKLGVGKQTYSNNEQGQICYITECIVPKLRQWEKELTIKLLTEEQIDKGYEIKGNINAELRGDMITQANFYDKMRSMGIYNINEIRDYEDLPSIGEDGETRLIGANSIPLQRLLAGSTTAEATPNPISQPNEENTEETEKTENKKFKKKKEKVNE